MWPKYRNFDEFERDEIRPGLRAGWSLDNINDPSSAELDFDEDPFERALLEADTDDEEEDFDGDGADVNTVDFARDVEDVDFNADDEAGSLFSNADAEESEL